jgi:hypothetical protein
VRAIELSFDIIAVQLRLFDFGGQQPERNRCHYTVYLGSGMAAHRRKIDGESRRSPLLHSGAKHRPPPVDGWRAFRLGEAGSDCTLALAERDYSSEAAQHNEGERFLPCHFRPKASDNQFLGRAIENLSNS